MANAGKTPLTNSHDYSLQGSHTRNQSRGERLSKVRTRSRSNTATSTNSSHESPESLVASVDDRTRPMTRDDLSPVSSNEQKLTAKSLLARGGRMLKRSGSKFNLLTLNEDHAQEFRPFQEKFDVLRSRSRPATARGTDPLL